MQRKEVLSALETELDYLKTQIEKLQSEYNGLLGVVERIRNEVNGVTPQVNPAELPTDKNRDTTIVEPLGLTAAIKHIFSKNPNKEYTPLTVRDELENMRERGEFKTENQRYLPTVHTTLKSFVKRGLLAVRTHRGKTLYSAIR